MVDMKFQGKLMIQSQENGKKPYFGPHLGPLLPKLGRQFFFKKLWLCQSLHIIVSYHYAQYQRKLMIRSSKNLVTDGRTDRSTDIETNRRIRMIS